MKNPVNGSVLAHLRIVTRPAHDQIENAINLLDEKLDLARYMGILERFYGFWRSWEPLTGLLLPDDAFYRSRRRLFLLKADLATLGLSSSAMEFLPLCPAPPLRNHAEALGSLYVMEGSTLGGRVIQQNVKRCLGLTEQAGCRYFAGYGSNTGAMWWSFLNRLEQTPVDDVIAVGNGALATFERLTVWLTA
jgi:heme oxygenase